MKIYCKFNSSIVNQVDILTNHVNLISKTVHLPIITFLIDLKSFLLPTIPYHCEQISQLDLYSAKFMNYPHL